MRVLILGFVTFFLIACNSMSHKDSQENAGLIKSAKINTQLGISYLEQQDVSRAKQKLLLALKQAPNIPETWYSMGYFLESTGNVALAGTYYQKAISLEPNRGDVQNNYGTYLCRLGDYKGAIQHFMLAVNDPNYLHLDDAYENAGSCALKIPNYALADQYFQKAIQFDSTRSLALIELAKLNFMKKNYQESQNKLNEFLKYSAPTLQSKSLTLKLKSINGENF